MSVDRSLTVVHDESHKEGSVKRSSRKPRKGSWVNSRRLMFAASSVWVALILVILVLRSGGALPVPVAEPRVEPPVEVLARQAEALMARGEYVEAWHAYHQALLAAPEDVSLWYALGVTLSHLDLRTETEEAFQYVVRRGNPGSEEVRLARLWLVRAGVLAEPVAFIIAAEPVDVRGDTAVVRGKVTWGAHEPEGSALKAQVLMEGLNGAAEGKRFSARVPLGQSYRFERLPPGVYRLIGGAAGHRLWDLTLAVEDGQQIALHLSKENSSNSTVAVHP